MKYESIKNIIKLPVPHGYRFEKLKNILMCEAQNNYTKVYLFNGESLMISKTLKIIQEILPEKYFFRISRKHIINLFYVKKYFKKDCLKIILVTGQEVFLSKRRKFDFLKAIEKLH